MLAPTKAILLMFLAYLMGSIPFGFIIALFYGGIDIREHGSKNIGMTNVFRTIGPLPGLATLFLDALKGYIPVALTLAWLKPDEFGDGYEMWAVIVCMIAFLAVIGHIFPVWLNFQGGKSVAVSLGILAALMHGWVLVPILVFILTVLISRYVSLGSILSSISVPVIFIFFKSYPLPGNNSDTVFIGFAFLLMLMVLFRHVSNIKRLINGTENRFGLKKSKSKQPRTKTQKEDGAVKAMESEIREIPPQPFENTSEKKSESDDSVV